MRAILVHRFGGPEVLTPGEAPTPTPGEGEALVRIHAAGVNPVDTYVRSGAYARLPELPFIPGWDGAGVVEGLGMAPGGGSGVERPRIGERVYFSGTASGRSVGAYAQFVCCRDQQVHPLPDRLSFEQGAAIGVPYGTAHRALFHRGQAIPGETLLVHGASGAVGLAAVQLARAHGLSVIGTAGSDAGLELVKASGATHAIRHGTSGAADDIHAATGGRGVDLILEMLANANLDRDLGLLAQRGRVVVIGNRGKVEIDARQTMTKDASILGMSLWNASEDEVREIHQRLAPALSDGTLTPHVGAAFAMADAARAHEAVMTPGARGKVVLTIG